jgi:hypothetical protein
VATRLLRSNSVVIGGLLLLLAAGFAVQHPWATPLWPWPEGRLSFLFLSSIAAALAMPILWIGLSGEWGAGAIGSLFPITTFGGMTIFLAERVMTGQPALLSFALGAAGIALFTGLFFLWSRRIPLRDGRPMPRPVRGSFVAFAAVLILVGGALVLGLPGVMPWPIRPESSVMFGLIFLGAATSYAAAATRPVWHAARGPLLGFLAYDLILIGPLAAHLGAVRPEFRPSLIVYILVLLYSGALGVVYLFLHRATRYWSIRPGRPSPAAGA